MSSLRRFVDAVRQVAPDATGTPVFIVEAAATIVKAFLQAGALVARCRSRSSCFVGAAPVTDVAADARAAAGRHRRDARNLRRDRA